MHTAIRAAPRAALVALSLAGGVACQSQPTSSARRSDALATSVATGPMAAAHVRGAATRLGDGRVLVSGGWSPSGNLVDLYDPATCSWVAGPPSLAAHTDHAALTVAGGRVVLAGGTGASVEILDLAAGTWTQLDDAYRQYAAAALLADGRVLVTGGDGLGAEVAGASLVDPVAATIQPVGSLLTPRDTHRAVTLADGRVLILGGRNGSGTALASAELYDPQAGWFTAAASMTSARMIPAVARLQDGRVLVTGGWNGAELSSAEIYDPSSDAWTPAGPLVHARQLHEALPLPDGRVAVLGGLGTNSAVIADVELFDPAAGGTFTIGATLSVPRYYASSVVLESGLLLVASGTVPGSTGEATAEIVSVSACTAATCASLGASCGQVADGCGGVLSCGNCGPAMTCSANACVACTPGTCASLGASCGQVADGCGGVLSCGNCGPGMTCKANACTACGPSKVTWTTCATAGATCGTVVDDCGGTLDCGTCGAGLVCVAGSCCAPTTCAAQGRSCGALPDGCGGTLSCGTCPAGSTCGAAGACVSAPVTVFDPTWKAPLCPAGAASCSSGSLLVGRASVGPEANAPNTIDGCADGAGGTFHGDESLDALRIATLDGAPFAAGSAVRLEADVWAYSGFSSDALDLFIAAEAQHPVWTRIATLVPTHAGAQTLSATTTLPRGGAVQAIRAQFRFGGGSGACVAGSYNDRDDLLFATAQPPDSVPPTVTISSPAAGYIGGKPVLEASAGDDVGVVRVAFLDGDVLVGTALAAPWQVPWDTTVLPDGARTLTAVAYDAAGNGGTASRAVVIDNTAPTAALVSPAPGAFVTGTVTLSATAGDAVGVVRVSFFDGATLLGTVTAPPWTMAWPTAAAAPGAHTLTARAYDAAGNAGTSVAVPVSVAGAPPSPVAQHDATRSVPACLGSGAACDSGNLLSGRASLGPELHAPNTLRGSCADGTSGSYHSDESLDRLKVSTLDGSPLASGKTVRVEATVWVWSAGLDRLDLWFTANADGPAWTLIGTLAPTASGQQTLAATYVLPAGSVQAVRGVFRYGGSPASCVAGSYNDVDDLAFAVQ